MDPLTILSIALGLGGLIGGGVAGWKSGQPTGKGGGNALTGTPASVQQFGRFTPQQEQFMNNILSTLGGQPNAEFSNTPFGKSLAALGTSNYQFQPNSLPAMRQYTPTYNPVAFKDIENQARADFASKTLPLLSERFGALGGSGTARSSGYAGALGSAGAGLERDLAAQRAGYEFQGQNLQTQQEALAQQLGLRQAALQLQNAYQNQQGAFGAAQFGQNVQQQNFANLLNAAGLGTGQRFDTAYIPGTSGILQQLGGGLASGLGSLGPLYAANKLGIL